MHRIQSGIYKYKGWILKFILRAGHWKAEKESHVQYGRTMMELRKVIDMVENQKVFNDGNRS